MLLADGHFIPKITLTSRYGSARPIITKSCPYNRFFSIKIFK